MTTGFPTEFAARAATEGAAISTPERGAMMGFTIETAPGGYYGRVIFSGPEGLGWFGNIDLDGGEVVEVWPED